LKIKKLILEKEIFLYFRGFIFGIGENPLITQGGNPENFKIPGTQLQGMGAKIL